MITMSEYSHNCQGEVIALIPEIQQKEYGISITEENQPDLINVYHFYHSDGGNFRGALNDGEIIGTIALKNIRD